MIRKAVPEDMDIVYKLISELEECEFPESEFKQIYDEILNSRPQINGEETFDIVKKNVKRLQDAQVSVGAIQTTTKKSLRYGKDIVDTYCNMGLHSLFPRQNVESPISAIIRPSSQV